MTVGITQPTKNQQSCHLKSRFVGIFLVNLTLFVYTELCFDVNKQTEVKIEKEEKLSNRKRFLLKVLIMKLTRILLRRYKFRNVHEPAPELSSGIAKNSKDYANLPERFLVRKTAKIAHKSEDHPAYVPRLNKWKAQYHGLER